MTITEMYSRWNEFGTMRYSEKEDFQKALAKCVAVRYGLDARIETDSIGHARYSNDGSLYPSVQQYCVEDEYPAVRIWTKEPPIMDGVFTQSARDFSAVSLDKLYKAIEKVTGWKPVGHDEEFGIIFMDIED